MGTLTKVAVEQEQAVERKAKVRVMSSSLSRALIVELSIFKLVMILVVFCQMEVFATSEKQQCEVFYFTLTSLWPHFEAMSPRFRTAWSQQTKSYSDNRAPQKGMDVLFTFALKTASFMCIFAQNCWLSFLYFRPPWLQQRPADNRHVFVLVLVSKTSSLIFA